ncbi:MAG TPA: hypothetical protein VGF67_25115 [Ktedonobacteraceae bacterium]|jgi:DNA invertase Pin-like site-specific DNA recombinase
MRKFKTSEELEQERKEALGLIPFHLPVEKLLVIYARQSTKGQVLKNRESALAQTEEQLERANDLGWVEENRLLLIENQAKDGKIRNASGRLRIDEREGLSTAMLYINSGEAGAVMTRDVARLFRDEDLVGPVVFAKACKDHHVLVITDDHTYDFNHPKRGKDDYKRFLAEAQAAADFLEKHIRGVMHKHRDRKGQRGEYIGHTLPIGMMLNSERTFYEPNPYHREQVKWLFKRFRALGGNLTPLRHEIVGTPLFPDFPLDTPPDIIERIGYINLRKVEGGWTIMSYDGLIYILTNPVYIGHMYYKGRIVKEHAHAAIVDEDDFWFAYYRLAHVDFQGNPITHPEGKTKRYYRKQNGATEALLGGLREDGTPVITTTMSERAGVYVVRDNGRLTYRINDRSKLAVNIGQAGLRVNALDHVFSERLLERLGEVVKLHPQGEHAAEMERQRLQVQQSLVQKLEDVQSSDGQAVDPLTTLRQSIARTKEVIKEKDRVSEVATGDMDDTDLRKHFRSLKELRRGLVEMEGKLNKLERENLEQKKTKAKLPTIYATWNELSIEEKQRFVRVATLSVTFDKIVSGWFQLRIEWAPLLGGAFIDEAVIWEPLGTGSEWTDEELTLLRQHYPTASRKWLLEQLPSRSWVSIARMGMRKCDTRAWSRNDSEIPSENLSMDDWKVIQEQLLPVEPIVAKRVYWREYGIIASQGHNSAPP